MVARNGPAFLSVALGMFLLLGRLAFGWCYCWSRFHKTSTHTRLYTPSIAFRHIPPNSARFSYATEGALFISAQLFSDAISALQVSK